MECTITKFYGLSGLFLDHNYEVVYNGFERSNNAAMTWGLSCVAVSNIHQAMLSQDLVNSISKCSFIAIKGLFFGTQLASLNTRTRVWRNLEPNEALAKLIPQRAFVFCENKTHY